MKAHALGIAIIFVRELRLFFGDWTQVVGSLLQPMLFLVVFGHGLAPSLSSNLNISYLSFLFPGMVGLTVLTTATSAGVSLLWDRQFSYLRIILVSPVPRSAIALGKVLGGVTIACIQGAIVLMAAPLLGISFPLLELPAMILMMLLGAAAMNLLGLAIVTRIRSLNGFQLVMGLVSMPMLLLSGAFFPLNQSPAWMRTLAFFDPYTYAIDGMRAAIGHSFVLLSFWADVGILAMLTVLLLFLTVRALSKPDNP